MFESVTYQEILQRMLGRVPSHLDKREGSVIWDALAPAAAELRQMYIELDNVLLEAFADTASRGFLIRRAAERNITPYPATPTILEGVFEPAELVVDGMRFSAPNRDVNYVVRERLTDNSYQVECETVGTVGDEYLGRILPIDKVAGLQTASLLRVLIPGRNEQSTESLRQTYLESFHGTAYGGNVKDYLDKTMAIGGVGGVKVTPVWQGGGTVKLTILDGQFNPASDLLIETVQEVMGHSEKGYGVAPIGHLVTVDTVNEVVITVSGRLVFARDYDWERVREQVAEQVENYLLELRQNWAGQQRIIVRITQLETRILSVQGVEDILGTAINGTGENLVLGEYEVPTFGGVVHETN